MNTERKVWMAPKFSPTNKYNEAFSRTLEKQGIRVEHFVRNKLFFLKSGDILHLHWPHSLYQNNHWLFFCIKSALFLLALRYLKLKQVYLVWTLHNLYPHKCKYKRMEKWVRNKILVHCSVVTVASESIKESLIEEFNVDPAKVQILYHGHYRGIYPVNNQDFRRKYGIPEDKFVYLHIGAIKPYKGVEELIETFLKLRNNNTHLIIAGKLYEGMEGVLERFKGNKNLTLDFRFISDDELADIITCSNVVVLPYKAITTSGTAILACSLNKPIICPDTPFMREYFNSHIAHLYSTESGTTGLLDKLEQVLEHSCKESNLIAYFDDFANKFDWDLIGVRLTSLYKSFR